MQRNVLLVDDEPMLLAGLRRALRKEPYEILTAVSARDALGILQSQPVDAVVSDQDMPGMKGTEFLTKVRQEYPDVIRFMLTGKATVEVAVEAINKGAVSHFFAKPCNPIDLAFTIRQALQYKDLMAEAIRLLQVNRRQAALIERLEQKHPGMTKVERDADGVILIPPTPLGYEELVREIARRVAEAP